MPQTPKQFLNWLDSEAAEFGTKTTREFYQNYAGLKDKLALASIYRKHAKLFERETVDKLLRTRSKDKRLPNLREFAVGGYLEQAAKKLTEKIAARETSDSIEWDGKQVPYRSVQQLMINEDEPAKRRDLEQRQLELTSAQNTLREDRWDLLYQQAADLGFASYAELCDQLGALDLEGLRAMVDRLLWDTEKSYRASLERELRAIGVDPTQAERSDLLRLFRSPKFDALFPRDAMLPALDASLRALGVDVDNQPNVIVDDEERPRKSPRAFCAPVLIPDEIYLVISPHGGHDDYRALFHEAGHAQHFAHIPGDKPYAFRGEGDNSVTEGFAFFLEHLLYSEPWLEKHLGMTNHAEYLSLVKFHKIYFLRRYAAKLLYEMEMHSHDNVRSYSKLYADLLTTHVGVRYSSEDYLADLDDGFYCARYLRAWIFEAQLRSVFVRRWGETWFESEKAGKALRELWSHGQQYSAVELLRQFDEPGLDTGPVIADVAGID
jgi:hypothetical protein